MKLIMETWRRFVREAAEERDQSPLMKTPNFDIKTQEPLTDKGMELCAGRQDCFEKHLIDKIYLSGKEEEYSNLIDIAKAAAERDKWFTGRNAPWDYRWENGLVQGYKDEDDSELNILYFLLFRYLSFLLPRFL